ncbi:MAG: amino acid--tRNA ligase-related protein [Bacteroidota bacterium]
MQKGAKLNLPIKDIKAIDTLLISEYSNTIRSFFLKNNYYEVSLFNTTKHRITNTNQIKTSTGDFLRYTTEPEIWKQGLDLDKFFCLTSLFREEDEASLLHKNEFKIVDFYIKNGNPELIVKIFFEVLEYLESSLKLPKLSKLNIIPSDFEEFNNDKFSGVPKTIYKVDNYPITESFYDAADIKTGKSKKSELFYSDVGQLIEFSVFGQVDKNSNPQNKIENYTFGNTEIKSLNLYGMCLGIERTILCYETLKHSLAG